MPVWAAIVVAVVSSSTLSLLVGWWLNRRQNEEVARKAHLDTQQAVDAALAAARAETQKWYDEWKEEADARAADREAFSKKMGELEEKGRLRDREIAALRLTIEELRGRLIAAGLPCGA